MSEQPRVFPLVEVVREAEDVVTLWFEGDLAIRAGQFVMVWLPRLDEKPFVVSWLKPGRFGVTARRRGPFTSALVDLAPGAKVGVRGPYGNGFDVEAPLVLVAGGVAVATVAPLKDLYPESRLIYGARTKAELIWRDRFPDMTVCTDDGSEGLHGFPTEPLRETLETERPAAVCVCGPEAMMVAALRECEAAGAPMQAGLERHMKCGFGVCGQCACGDRLVCQDGPVFDSAALRRMEEFGRTAMLKSGRVVDVADCAR